MLAQLALVLIISIGLILGLADSLAALLVGAGVGIRRTV